MPGFDPEPQPETLAKRLTYARRRLGLTQEDLAEKLDVGPGTILRWEKGEGVPPAKKLERLGICCPRTPPAISRTTGLWHHGKRPAISGCESG